MAGLGELNSVQAPLVQALVDAGWTHVPGDKLDRATEQPFVESQVVDALVRLNPLIAEDPARVDEVLPTLRSLTLGARNDGLIAANQTFTGSLRGLHHHEFVGTHGHVPVKLIDFEDLSNNRFVVSDEVTYGAPGHKARFDVVLWVNGFPLVVGELKTAVNQRISWVAGAREIAEHYEVNYPEFFVPGVFSFATEGKELTCAATGTPVEHWEPWGPTEEGPRLANVLESAKDLLAPDTVLDLLADFTLYETAQDENSPQLIKLVARYMQYEAVTLMHERARSGESRRGLIYHTQGSGKTLAMVFAAGKLLREPILANPTVILIADRVQLVRQVWDQFRTTSMPRLHAPRTAAELRSMIGQRDQRGLIFTTVHKFAGAPVLSERDNIVVLVDEAHRTQEGNLGLAMRVALPNALFFGFSGTPLAELDRNTFDTFGDPGDEGRVLHSYDSDQSIADGMTLPIHVAPRMVQFDLDTEMLDEAFEELTQTEGLDEEQAETISRRASRVSTFFGNRDRVRAVCADIVEHFYSTIDPLGLKAQIVVYDRAACVAYHEELTALLEQRHYDEQPLDEAAVVMTVGTAKGDDPEWQKYRLDDASEAALLKRFRTYGNQLKFLIVTSKLGTGFNAPIEGVMYLDKPLKNHTLFQTITRTNRTWRNPETGQDKHFGLVVDYVGLGDGFARAMAPANPDQQRRSIDVEGLIDAFEAELEVAMLRFAGIDHTTVGLQTLQDAQQRVPDKDAADKFAAQYKALEGIWEAASPQARLAEHRDAYRFLSQVYASIMPTSGKDDRLWARLGAKTLALVHEHMSDIKVTGADEVVIADTDTVQTLVDEGLIPDLKEVEHKSAGDIVDSIAARLRRALDGPNGDHPVYRSLAERLDNLRTRTLAAAEASAEFLRELFTVARDMRIAEKAEAEGGREGLDLLPDPRIGALTQIFNEYAPTDRPVMVERVVHEIDDIVKDVTADNSGWAATQKGDRLVRREVRAVLRKHQLHRVPDLFDRAYEYIAENY